MINKYQCKKCGNTVHIDKKPESRKRKIKNGILVDFYTEKPIVEESILCSMCSSLMEVSIDGVPSANFPLSDLDFSVSKKRMSEGLYNDMSSKTKKKAKELKQEMNYHNSSHV
jgi:hypothetical protein